MTEREKLTIEQVKEQVKNFYNENENDIKNSYALYQNYITHEFYQNSYTSLNEKYLQEKLKNYPILILTANSVETGVLHAWLKKENETIEKLSHRDITYYFFRWREYNIVNVWAGTTGSNTEHGSSWTLRKIFEDYTPKLVLSLGVAFGISPDTQKLGDVIVSKKIYVYDKGIKLTNNKIEIKNEHSFKINSWIGERLRQRQDFMYKNDKRFETIYGSIVTGEAVVDDPKAKKAILDAVNKDIIGGEMEAYGMFSECHNKGIPCVTIKGICDWGVGKNVLSNDPQINDEIKDGLQAYAMNNVLIDCDLLFIEENLFEGDIKHTVPIDSNLKRYIDDGKIIAFFERYKHVVYFILFSIFVLLAVYRLINNIHLNTYAILLLFAFLLLVLCFGGSGFLLMKYKKILQKLIEEINDLKNRENKK